MNIRAIAFTQQGQSWQEKLGFPVDRGIPVHQWTQDNFDRADALLYIGACGIAVRAIAPHVKDKTTDPAVLVMDELGRHIIPVLSGHIGGANELSMELAAKTGAIPVITTATDLRGVPAADNWAVANGCTIENPSAIKAVSAAALAGAKVGVAITERKIEPPFPVTLLLRPRTLVLGAGCKKGLDGELFEQNVRSFLDKNGVSLLSLKALATIDIKKEEAAFVRFCEKYGLQLLCYSAQKLTTLPGAFSYSDFVEKTVGVGNVCERAAVCAGESLLVGKTVFEGTTLALAGDRQA